MLRFLYITDLHGNTHAYNLLPSICREHKLDIIINGGDILPKRGNMMHLAQQAFIRDFLPNFFNTCNASHIRYYAMFGNDDLRAFHPDWLALVDRHENVFDLERCWHPLDGGYWIRGSSFVPDYPFGLKDWCLRDRPDALPVPTLRSVISTRRGMKLIDNPFAFFNSRPTLADHLESLVDPSLPMRRCIMVPHAPPSGLGLGLLYNKEDVGSQSVRSFIDQHQPLLVLSGHIHESPDVGQTPSGQPHHTAISGLSTCHQPGQALPRQLTASIIEIDDQSDSPSVRIQWSRHHLPD